MRPVKDGKPARFCDDLFRFAGTEPGKLFLSWDGEETSYGEAAEKVRKLAKELLRFPLRGQTLAIRVADVPGQLFWFLAAEAAGAVPVLVHEYLKPEELTALQQERPLSALLADVPVGDFHRVACSGCWLSLCQKRPERTGIGVLTSGTSGLPKVLFRTAESWRDFFPVQNRIFSIDGSARLFFQGSLAFTGNLNMVLAFLSEGASLYGTARLFPRGWMKTIRSHYISHIYLIPSKLSPLGKTAGTAGSVRYILTGSQLVTAKLLSRLEDRFPEVEVILYYGASELSYVSYIRGVDIRNHPDSVGRPFPGISVSIRGGEIYVDTDYGVEGLSRPATCHDLGELDEEGAIRFLGRREDMYHVKGNHVSRQKILSHLLMVPGVEEAEVLPTKQENGDDFLTAFLVGDGLTSGAVVHALETHLQPWEIPKQFHFLKRLPKTSTGKVDRRALAQLAGD